MILALETAGPITKFWLYPARPDEAAVAEHTWESGRMLADQLLAQLVEFLGHRPVDQQTLTGIIIFAGPGSFTSLRIGHAVANALADSLEIPVLSEQGTDWASTGRHAIASAPLGRSALPHYGSEPNVTRPKP